MNEIWRVVGHSAPEGKQNIWRSWGLLDAAPIVVPILPSKKDL